MKFSSLSHIRGVIVSGKYLNISHIITLRGVKTLSAYRFFAKHLRWVNFVECWWFAAAQSSAKARKVNSLAVGTNVSIYSETRELIDPEPEDSHDCCWTTPGRLHHLSKSLATIRVQGPLVRRRRRRERWNFYCLYAFLEIYCFKNKYRHIWQYALDQAAI